MNPTNSDSAHDLSAGDNPPSDEEEKANATLDDAKSRRQYRSLAVGLAVVVVGFFSVVLYRLVCAVITYVTSFSPWVVGMFATLVVAMAVITLALLRAVFAAPGGSEGKDLQTMPQVSVLSDALKVLGDAVNALRSSVGK